MLLSPFHVFLAKVSDSSTALQDCMRNLQQSQLNSRHEISRNPGKSEALPNYLDKDAQSLQQLSRMSRDELASGNVQFTAGLKPLIDSVYNPTNFDAQPKRIAGMYGRIRADCVPTISAIIPALPLLARYSDPNAQAEMLTRIQTFCGGASNASNRPVPTSISPWRQMTRFHASP